MPPLSHLTSCTPTKSNLYHNNSLAAAAVRNPDLCRLLTFQVPNLMALFHCLGQTKISVQIQAFLCEQFITWYCLQQGIVSMSRSSWRSNPCQLSTTAYSIYSHLLYKLEAIPPSGTWGLALPWWQGPTYHGCVSIESQIKTLYWRT